YVTYGSSSLSGTIDFNSATADIEILGTEENSTGTGIGNTVLAGDVNGDSRTDLFFGYYHAKESTWSNPGYSGVIWGIFGTSTPNSSYDLASFEYDFKTYGTTTSVYGVGYRGCIGDLNSDGYGDLVLYASDAPSSSVNVMFGGSTFASGSIETIRDVSVSLPTNQGLGAVSSGDFNGDGIKDLFVGNPFASPTGGTWAGSAYLFYGNTSLPATLDISTDTDILITGDDANDYCGGQNTLGDVNGDGADDIFIASPNGDISGRSNCGKVYLIYGDAPTSAFSSPMFAGAGDIAPMFFSTARVSIDFNDPSGGAGTVTCEFNPTAPGGTGLPASVLPVYWSLTSTKTGTMNNTQVSFHYTDAQLGTMDENNLSVFTREGSGDDWTEVPGATVDANSNKITCETSHFSEWTVGENDEPLAIELSSFVAVQVNQKIVLAWITESETDNKGFRLFRKENSDFLEIGNFYSHSELIGQGNKTSKTNYTFTDAFVTTGKTYSYKLVDVDFDGTETEHETVSITVSKESEQTSHKFSYSLEQNFPNPFNPNTTISYTLAKTNDVKLEVFNTKGELVRTLVSEKQNEGSHASNWNGTDERGNAVSSGVYYCKLTAGNFSQTQKMTLLK
ncbi:FG-GAP repeat protein, partial [bacterium]|nr:FG-GAP repeat protein [bacterium]